MMTSFAELVPIPPGINVGLSACREETMLELFGEPGSLTDKCGAVSGRIAERIRYGVDVGPVRVSGLDVAVESLEQVLQRVQIESPETWKAIKTAGMLCVRRIKHNPAHYSNHSWGAAIDLYFGTHVVGQGVTMAQRGFLSLYETFNKHGWFWGAGFSGSSVDSMHFELADETVRALSSSSPKGLLVSANDYIQAMGYEEDKEPT